MAKRINLYHDQNTRQKIQTTMLLKRLTAHANGEIELSQTQVRAIEILLKKSMPDLSAVEQHVTQEEAVRVYAEVPEQSASTEEWVKQLAKPLNKHAY